MERNIMLTLQDSYKYFTKQSLTRANNVAHRTNRNRALDKKALSTLIFTYGDEVRFPITFSMPHHHAAGQEVEEHFRCKVILDGEGASGMIDIDADLFQRLERIEVPESN